jgi:Amidase
MAWNSKVYADWSPKKDAEVVRRMRNAGGVLLGKVHTHEFAWGVTTPPTRNPWDGRSVTGGSSGGSGSSVAAGQGMASWGTDCGCSVRNPSALNGCAGMRVTQGRVPASGVVPLSLTMDTVGPLARTVRDLRSAPPAGCARRQLGPPVFELFGRMTPAKNEAPNAVLSLATNRPLCQTLAPIWRLGRSGCRHFASGIF